MSAFGTDRWLLFRKILGAPFPDVAKKPRYLICRITNSPSGLWNQIQRGFAQIFENFTTGVDQKDFPSPQAKFWGFNTKKVQRC